MRFFKRFSLYELHRVKVVFNGSTQVEDRGNIRVTNACRCTGFAQKTEPRRFITKVPLADDLQSHGAAQIDVESLVCDAHCTPTQFDRFPVFAHHQLVVVIPLGWLAQYWFECIRSRRLTGLNATAKTLAEHAYRAEFHRSRHFITAARADAFGLSAHIPSRLSAAASGVNNTTVLRLARTPSG
jgi:hypothetical protein